LLVGAEATNPAVRRSSDIFSLVDSQLIVSIPHIYNKTDIRRRRNRTMLAVGSFVAVLVAGLVAIFFVLPPLDVLFQKIMATLFR
ncbi:MAG TPA: hypothetical protein VIK28_05895, partial [Sedimentisphaerales bacterium]